MKGRVIMSMSKVEEIIAATKLGELMHKKEAEDKKKNKIFIILMAVAAVAAVVCVAYLLYKHFCPKYMEDLEEDLDEDFEDDFFEEDEA